MRKNLLIIWSILLSGSMFGQTNSGAMPMDSINGMTIATCSGLFADSGGHFYNC